MRKFDHLHVPRQWRHYWSKHPEGYTILEALFNWVNQVDKMVDNQNDLNDTVSKFKTDLDSFINRFDDRLTTEVTETLNEWQKTGYLDYVISEALDNEIDDVRMFLERVHNTKIDSVQQEGNYLVFRSNGSTVTTISLTGVSNAQNVQDYVDTLVRRGDITAATLGEGTVGLTEVIRRTFNNSIFSEKMLSNDMISMFDKSAITENTVISGYGGDLITLAGYYITDYMPISKGSRLYMTANGKNIFTLPPDGVRKIGLWTSDYTHYETVAIRDIENYVAPAGGFVRVVLSNAEEGVYISTSDNKRLASHSVQHYEAPVLKPYVTKEVINLYNPDNRLLEGAYRSFTDIVDYYPEGFQVTEKIYIPASSTVHIRVDGNHLFDSTAPNKNSTKLIVFDIFGNWESTKHINTYADGIKFTEPKEIRFQVTTDHTIDSITTDKIRKLDYSKMTNTPVNDETGSGADVFLFMGQSNMAGRGIQTTEHPELAPDVSSIAYEYRAITAPNELTPLVEPFGENENTTDGINDGTKKTGSMVSSFAKAYHEATGKKMIGISASKGGSSILEWTNGTAFLNDTINRINEFKDFATSNGIKVKGYYVVWNQGEGDGDVTQSEYEGHLNNMINALKPHGIEKLLLVRVGHLVDDPDSYQVMLEAQTNIGKDNKDVVLVGTKFAELALNGYLKDEVHFVQAGYNIQGEQAGINTAYYLNNKKEPLIYDTEYNNLYYSHKL